MTICDSLRLFPLNLHIYEDYGDFLYFSDISEFSFSLFVEKHQSMIFEIDLILLFIKFVRNLKSYLIII